MCISDKCPIPKSLSIQKNKQNVFDSIYTWECTKKEHFYVIIKNK